MRRTRQQEDTWVYEALFDSEREEVVRYRTQGNQGRAWTSTLADYGSDATTPLDSY